MTANKNWVGDRKSIFVTLWASNHTDHDRQNEDYYATDPVAIDYLFNEEKFDWLIREPACGEGHLSKRMIELGANVVSSDLVNRQYGEYYGLDFLNDNVPFEWVKHIITNPPYKFWKEFVERALEVVPEGWKVAMFLKVQFLEGKARKKLFLKTPPKTVYISSSRIICAKNGKFARKDENGKTIKEKWMITSSAVAYAWYVREKWFQGDPVIKWIN